MELIIKIPKSWNECSDAQLKKLANLIYSGINGFKFDYKCFRILVSEKWWHFNTKAKLNCLLTNVPISELKQDFNFIFISNTLTRFPVIQSIGKEQFHPPLPQISNLSIGEMAVADDLHIKWRTTGDLDCLYYLAATLYVSQQQPRPAFDKNDLSFKVSLFKQLSLDELLVIEMAFHGCKEYLAKKFKTVFPSPKHDSPKKSSTNQSSHFPKLILDLSGGKFGNHEQTSRTNCYTFLAEFEKLLKDQK